MSVDLEKFGGEDWFQFVPLLEHAIRNEIHGGLIKHYRDSFQTERASKLDELRTKFYRDINIGNLDEQLNDFTQSIKNINAHTQNFINFNLINYTKNNHNSLALLYPVTTQVVDYLSNSNSEIETSSRIQGVLNKVIFDSSNQSNKANAGKAGEEFVEVMLYAIGLEENNHFKKQHKSHAYSDTDFVFPYVDHYKDVGVEIYAAVQFSSNDRFRMVGGELKSGANAVAISGNGFSASSKNLDDIGAKILTGMMQKNHRLICYGPEIERKILQLEKQLKMKTKAGTPYKNAVDQQTKLTFYRDYAVSFSKFAGELQRRFL
jgi:hypothetical protein